MAIEVKCSCGALHKFRESAAGQVLHCPQCNILLTVPAAPVAVHAGSAVGQSAPSAPPSSPPLIQQGMLAMPTISDDMLATSGEILDLPVETVADGRIDFEKGMSLWPRLTILLIVANVIIFFITLAKGALESKEAIIQAGALSRDHVLAGEVWRLVSAMFLHGGFDHLFGNAIVLYILGMACEHGYGLARTAWLYMFTGVCASLVSISLSEGPSVGASGAIFGLMGAAIVFFRKHGKTFYVRDNRVGIVLIVWAGYSILTGFLDPFIDNFAHIGGLLSGIGLALVIEPALVTRANSGGLPASP